MTGTGTGTDTGTGADAGRGGEAARPGDAELERLCVALAVAAGHRAAAGRRAGVAVSAKSTPTDLVTSVDREVERWLLDEVARLRPDDTVFGEEEAGHDGAAPRSGVRWVVDPIDGTVNFVLGIPHYAVSVAAEVDGVVVAGAVHDPVSGETFHARRGVGAVLLGRLGPPQPLTGPRDVPLARAVVATGFAYDPQVRTRQAAVVAQLLPRIADIRRIGSAALDLCYLAAGRLDAHFEAGLHLWDYAAGALIAREAGCVVTGLSGRPADDRFLLAARPELVGPLGAVLAELGADTVRPQA